VTGVHVRAVVADRDVDIEFTTTAGEVLAVLGPNGAGKSTTLHVIAGLVRPDEGLVRLGGRVLTDTASGVFVPTHARRVGMLLQDALLFPHLNVAANVAFAPRSGHRGRPRREARATAEHWLAKVDAAGLAARMPRQLSGGQAQRVALARALYGDPFLIVLDEPNSNLDSEGDEALTGAVRSARARGAIVVVVAHRPVGIEAVDQLLVLKDGRMQAFGPKETVLGQVLQRVPAPPPIKIVSDAGAAKS
jgi:molybdate transport system ATP-binding protein